MGSFGKTHSILLHCAVIISKTSAVKTAAENITTSTASVPTTSTCKEIALRDYRTQLDSIAGLMTNYKHLVLKDFNDILKVVNTINAADVKAALEMKK